MLVKQAILLSCSALSCAALWAIKLIKVQHAVDGFDLLLSIDVADNHL